MSGLYFIAAGISSKNRGKSLDKELSAETVSSYLDDKQKKDLRRFYSNSDPVYAWGANRSGDLEKLVYGDYVVDVKNAIVVQVFQFTFCIETSNLYLQEWIGWDSEKPSNLRRLYKHVYFLKNPQKTAHIDKSYFQRAFNLEKNQNWLVGQRWFSESECRSAMNRTNSTSLESFLGLVAVKACPVNTLASPSTEITNANIHALPNVECLKPPHLEPIIQRIYELKEREKRSERDHEDLVTHLFEVLGYIRGKDIRYQSGRVDIIITKNKRIPKIVIEVKRDWTITTSSKAYIKQIHNYALEAGAIWAILTNGDKYLVYNREKGLSYEDQFVGEFILTVLNKQGLEIMEMLKNDGRAKELGLT